MEPNDRKRSRGIDFTYELVKRIKTDIKNEPSDKDFTVLHHPTKQNNDLTDVKAEVFLDNENSHITNDLVTKIGPEIKHEPVEILIPDRLSTETQSLPKCIKQEPDDQQHLEVDGISVTHELVSKIKCEVKDDQAVVPDKEKLSHTNTLTEGTASDDLHSNLLPRDTHQIQVPQKPGCRSGEIGASNQVSSPSKVESSLSQVSNCIKGFKAKKPETHIKTNTSEKDLPTGFACDVCGMWFRLRCRLKAHKKNHSDARPWVCQTCGKTYKHKADLKSHQDIHLGKKVKKVPTRRKPVPKCTSDVEGILCQCVKCVKVTKSLEVNSTRIPSKRIYSCEFCTATFTTEGGWKAHRSNHLNPNKFFCDLCNILFVSKRTLRKHTIHKHSKEPLKYSCKLCESVFSYEYTLKKHVRRVHQLINPEKLIRHKCQYCDKTFHRSCALLTHCKQIHLREQQFICFHCDKIYYDRGYLEMHIKNKHMTKEKVFCNLCDLTFFSRHTLDLHTKTKHTEAKFSCDVCGKLFALKANLDRHRVGHFDDKPWVCKTCGKGFKRETNLQQHQITHSDSRPHSCSICNETFKLKTHVKQHMAVHGLLLTHKCNLCNNKFARKTELKQHLARVHSA